MKSKVSKESTLLVKAKELAEMLSVSTRHIWRMKAAGKLPRAFEIGHCVRWKLLDIFKQGFVKMVVTKGEIIVQSPGIHFALYFIPAQDRFDF